MGEFFKAGEGDFFVQDQRSEVFAHLTCVGLDELPLPQGDLTPVFCPDPSKKGEFMIDGFVQGEPATPTTTLTKPLSAVANWLLEQKCPFVGWTTWACGGIRGDPENYEIGILLFGMQVSNSSIVAPAVVQARADDTRIDTNAEVAYTDRVLIYQVDVAVQALNNTAAANAIAFLPEACESRCQPQRGLCEEGYMVLDGTLYNSEIKKTHDGGATWVPTSADPFTYAGGDASDVVVFETANGGHRAIISRGSMTLGEPAEVTITTDWGVTFVNVDVGAVNDQWINDLFSMQAKIWAAATDGYIYRSDDLGNTWIALESGVETNWALNSIVMHTLDEGYCVGNFNAFLYTTDGDEWNARVGPSVGTHLLSVATNDAGHVFVGAADGILYVSEDGGVTWAVRRNFGAGSIDWIAFDTSLKYIGVLVYNTAAGVGTTFRSKDGGASWQDPSGQVGAWNAGLNSGFICDANNWFVVGEVFDGTTFVAKASPSG